MLFTVFTPTYNRAHTLHRVYESLQKQTCRDFEWVIVDDGSTDNTHAVVEKWAKETDFPIKYVRQENQGKHIAFNNGVRMATGELFVALDSDDAMVPEALQAFLDAWHAIPATDRDGYTGIGCLCMDENGRIVGTPFSKTERSTSFAEQQYIYNIRGEKWACHRTDILRKFPFPELKGQKYVPESTVWAPLTARYKMRFLNTPLRIYHSNDSAEERLMTSGSAAENCAGHVLLQQARLNHELCWFRHAPLSFFRSALNYARFSFHAGNSIRSQNAPLVPLARMIWALMLLPGYAAYRKDRLCGTK